MSTDTSTLVSYSRHTSVDSTHHKSSSFVLANFPNIPRNSPRRKDTIDSSQQTGGGNLDSAGVPSTVSHVASDSEKRLPGKKSITLGIDGNL